MMLTFTPLRYVVPDIRTQTSTAENKLPEYAYYPQQTSIIIFLATN